MVKERYRVPEVSVCKASMSITLTCLLAYLLTYLLHGAESFLRS